MHLETRGGDHGQRDQRRASALVKDSHLRIVRTCTVYLQSSKNAKPDGPTDMLSGLGKADDPGQALDLTSKTGSQEPQPVGLHRGIQLDEVLRVITVEPQPIALLRLGGAAEEGRPSTRREVWGLG